jgi:hypothetical protein
VIESRVIIQPGILLNFAPFPLRTARNQYLYDLRSRVVHEGFNFVKDEDIYEFQNLVIECLLKLLEIRDKNLASKIMDTSDLKKLIHHKESEALDQYLPNQPWL